MNVPTISQIPVVIEGNASTQLEVIRMMLAFDFLNLNSIQIY